MLGIDGEQQLLELEQKLLAAGIRHTAIREPDAPFFGGMTAIGVAPQPRTPELKRITKKLIKLGDGQ